MRIIFVLTLLLFSIATLGFAEQVGSAVIAEVVDVGNTVCPITGKAVSPKAPAVYQGKRYAFCCQHCGKKFEKNPERYLAQMKEGKPAEKEHAGHEHSH